jgi:hypothetical protein
MILGAFMGDEEGELVLLLLVPVTVDVELLELSSGL